MSQLAAIKAAVTLNDLADVLGYKPKSLAYIVYIKPETAKYNQFEIPKKNGGTRKISSPYPELNKLQKRVSELLQNCVAEINDAKKIDSNLSHGFKRKKSIMTNAFVHKSKRFVFNIDLENFFGNINFGRVRGFFIRNKHFELQDKVATILAQIICFNNQLPQGSPSSPVTSNLIGHILDIHLANLAKRHGCLYSRYADDLTFSTNKKHFPPEIALNTDPDNFTWIPGTDLQNVIAQAGFTINASKTRMQFKDSRQDVTGLVVNKKINTRVEYRRITKSMVNELIHTGTYYLPIEKDSATGLEPEKVLGTPDHLNGVLGFINMIASFRNDGEHPNPFKLKSSAKTYQKFKLYNDFFNTQCPVILCEGKTDNVYIRAALQELIDGYPTLGEKSTTNGKISLRPKIYNYTKTTGALMGLNGGSGDLCNFIRIYKAVTIKFKGPGKAHPIIILADNDKGAKDKNGIHAFLKDAPGGLANGMGDFYKIYENLYVVLTPIALGGESMIENFFDKSTLEIKLGSKVFNPNLPFDNKTQYGKHLFATQVVKKLQKEINFKGFIPILDRLAGVLNAHYSQKPK